MKEFSLGQAAIYSAGFFLALKILNDASREGAETPVVIPTAVKSIAPGEYVGNTKVTAAVEPQGSTYCAPPRLYDHGRRKCSTREEIARINIDSGLTTPSYSDAAKQAEQDVNQNINRGAAITTGLDYQAIYAAHPEIAPPVMVSSLGPALASNAMSFTFSSSKLNGLPYGDRGLSGFLRRRGLRL